MRLNVQGVRRNVVGSVISPEADAKSAPDRPPIALALSGGGSRAMAFHLGCLKALHQTGHLGAVRTISSVSGGSVLAALYCSYPGEFDAFDRKAREVLRRGFVWPAIIAAMTTTEGVKALASFLPLAVDRAAAMLTATGLKIAGSSVGMDWNWLRESSLLRKASRTTILRRVFNDLLEGRKLTELRQDRPRLVIIACELRAKAAFYYTAERLHCWRYGSADPAGVDLAEAVAASASYPVALPALDQALPFTKNGTTTIRRVTLTDGGVYDNLGLAPFSPDRDPTISLEVDPFDRIIACRAGYSLDVSSEPASFLPTRMVAAFECVHARAQNLATNRLFEWQASRKVEKVLLPYLGQDDQRLKFPPPDLVRRESVADYPTNFAAMSDEWIDRLSRRGEQMVHALLAEHWSGSSA